ncbi:MAG: hypothetical protein SXU28_03710, partial [Pseudomonadota bacterium]|nr:hypothetical protein [Pseudomonadota bacterium]
MNTCFKLLPALATLTLASPLLAQEGGDPSQADDAEPEIVVTGEGLEQALSIGVYATSEIPREQIIASSSGRIDDVLRNVAGFQQFRGSATGTPSSSTSARLVAFPPNARRVTPCAVGLEERLSDR